MDEATLINDHTAIDLIVGHGCRCCDQIAASNNTAVNVVDGVARQGNRAACGDLTGVGNDQFLLGGGGLQVVNVELTAPTVVFKPNLCMRIFLIPIFVIGIAGSSLYLLRGIALIIIAKISLVLVISDCLGRRCYTIDHVVPLGVVGEACRIDGEVLLRFNTGIVVRHRSGLTHNLAIGINATANDQVPQTDDQAVCTGVTEATDTQVH